MSVHTVERRQSEPAHDVRWRSPLDGANCSRRFESEADAVAFDAAMKARLALDRARTAWEAVPARWQIATDEEID